MKIVPRFALPTLLNSRGLDVATRDFPESASPYRLTVRECHPPIFVSGPHRKVQYPDGRLEGPFPVTDRPSLGAFLVEAFRLSGADAVLATIPEGAFWLNNKSQAAYLHKVADAQRVSRFLRCRGLTDRFQGGFILYAAQFECTLPLLAANTYAGGADVSFAAMGSSPTRLTAVSCHHFDIHFASTDGDLLQQIAERARPCGLEAESLALPDLPDWSDLWQSLEIIRS